MFDQTFNFHKYSDNLYSSGMPTKEQIESAKDHGIEVVINLAPNTVRNPLKDEENIVKNLNMDYYYIPVEWSHPTQEDFKKFVEIYQKLENKKVFVHCEANFRASSFITMYRVLIKGWDVEKAVSVMRSIWDDSSYPIWKEFVEDVLSKK